MYAGWTIKRCMELPAITVPALTCILPPYHTSLVIHARNLIVFIIALTHVWRPLSSTSVIRLELSKPAPGIVSCGRIRIYLPRHDVNDGPLPAAPIKPVNNTFNAFSRTLDIWNGSLWVSWVPRGQCVGQGRSTTHLGQVRFSWLQ